MVCFVRPRNGTTRSPRQPIGPSLPKEARIKLVDPTDPISLARDGFDGEQFEIVVSCMASRTGEPRDAWAIDHRAHTNLLKASQHAGASHFVLLSAICVQKPLLTFQKAKLAFEAELIASGMRYSIVRPTAYFKSQSGQIDRVRSGRPFLIFGNGQLTACKPISDGDLAAYIVGCLDDENRWNRILPIGGPGDAITPREQGEAIFALLGQPPRFRSVPVAMLDVIAGSIATIGRIVPPLAAKAELARIGRYYATESMLVLNPQTGQYDENATPSTGTQTILEFYRAVIAGEVRIERGDHSVF